MRMQDTEGPDQMNFRALTEYFAIHHEIPESDKEASISTTATQNTLFSRIDARLFEHKNLLSLASKHVSENVLQTAFL